MSGQIKRSGGFWVSGQYYPNQLFQSAFDMLGDFLTGETVSPPAKIGIMDASENMLALNDATFTQTPFTDPAIGVTVKGAASFTAVEVSADIAFFVLADENGILLAQAAVDPVIPAASGIVVTRQDVISEA